MPTFLPKLFDKYPLMIWKNKLDYFNQTEIIYAQ